MKTSTRFFMIVAFLMAYVGAFAQPSTSASTPPYPANQVISVYSDTYTTNIMGPNGWEDWNGNTFSTVLLDGNTTLKDIATCCFGTSFTTPTIDVSGMTNLHVDIYPVTTTTMSFGMVIGGKDINKALTLTTGQWNSIDLKLADLKTLFPSADFTNVGQIGFQGVNGTFYLDNIYFWTDVVPTISVSTTFLTIAQPANSTGNFNVTASQNWTASSDQSWLTVSPTSGTSAGATVTLTATANTLTTSRTATVTVTGADATTKTVTVTQTGSPIPASPTPTSAAAKVLSIYSDSYTAAVTNFVYLNQQWWNSTWSAVTLADGGNALKLVATTTGGGGGGVQFDALTITGMTNLHFDIYPGTDAASATMKYCVAPAGAWIVLPTPSNYSSLTANAWNSFDIPVSSLASGASTLPYQVGFGTFSGPGTFYVDNIYFYNNASTGLSAVTAANGINCFPNLVVDKITVSAKSQISEIAVHNLLGQSVKTELINATSKTVDLSNIAAGNYFVTIKLANGQIATQKIVKR